MKKLFIGVLSVLSLMSIPVPALAGNAVPEMATIIMHLNHYPTADEKKELAGIVADEHATDGEKTIAAALMRMQHHVEGADADALHRLIAGDAATAVEKDLAAILLGLTHHASSADIDKLKTMVN